MTPEPKSVDKLYQNNTYCTNNDLYDNKNNLYDDYDDHSYQINYDPSECNSYIDGFKDSPDAHPLNNLPLENMLSLYFYPNESSNNDVANQQSYDNNNYQADDNYYNNDENKNDDYDNYNYNYSNNYHKYEDN